MLRFDIKNTLKAGLVAALLAAPMAASAQSPFTMIIQFTQPIVENSPLVPIAPPTAPGNYGICVFIARGGNGVGPIAIPEYISGGSIRLHYNNAQISDPVPPNAGNINSIQLNRNGVDRKSVV